MALDRMTIGRFSLITRLPIRLLRLYDRQGLMVPEVRDLDPDPRRSRILTH